MSPHSAVYIFNKTSAKITAAFKEVGGDDGEEWHDFGNIEVDGGGRYGFYAFHFSTSKKYKIGVQREGGHHHEYPHEITYAPGDDTLNLDATEHDGKIELKKSSIP